MTTYPLSLYDQHPIIQVDDFTILIDTGSPSTIHVTDTLVFNNQTYQCSTNYMGLTVESLSELLGMKITTLLGADILKNYAILFNYPEQQVTFSEEELKLEGESFSIESFMDIPIIKATIKEQELKFFLDTGAKLSYLSSTYTQGETSLGEASDFYPGVGKFTTPVYELPTILGSSTLQIQYGNLPEILQLTLMLGGTNGILGSDLFTSKTILLDLKKKRLCVGG